MDDDIGAPPPILRHKNHLASSVFTPDALLREARRQKGVANGPVPDICILDPDGDIVRYLLATDPLAGSPRGPAIIPSSLSSSMKV